ncbi:probable disease resistance RPP8-like protein 2 [Prunus avium]|uniref:Probable disease resistance RPP8-like protein 2 n=1 Tax=Prunus avium TaxID=42229 RepID=A0A6P5T6J6_PRUAV|nr:probable disease resistance RPP8-like protein 2 [Prunus avium]XP_021822783.1 probable disease resistance RPP8-like protein 2 [Prunus avium]
MAEAVVSIVTEGLKPLGDFILQEANFLSGVGEQVELAQTELRLMLGYLKDADAKQGEDEVVRVWVATVRDAAYDLEDVIETFVLKVASKRKGSMTIVLKRFACILREGSYLHKTGSEIEKITTKLSKLRSRMECYDIKAIGSGSEGSSSSVDRQHDQRLTYAHFSERHVVGIEGDVEILATHLMKEEEEQFHRVVSIWGMGGSGKTTLARQVYHHNKVRRHFDSFAWVCVSQQYEGRGVLEEVLIKLTAATKEQREEIERKKRDEIAELLYNLLENMSCLVVLDDVWNTGTWNSIKAGFPVNKRTRSCILLTTRNKEVALHVDENGFLHESRPLNANESWKLFENIAIFGRDDTVVEIYAKKEELGKKMLQHCGGLPLAVIVLAELLARKRTVDEWYKVYKNVDVYIRRGTELEPEYKNQGYKGASWVLALSYDHLPYRLKLCFLYLGHFPEDYEIPVKRLTQLWMAEGLISSTSIDMIEDVSYGCLIELVERCMVQVGKYGSSKKIKTCRLHDLMRDLCLSKGKEENFFDIVNFASTASKAAPIGKVRRRAIYLDEKVDYLAPTRHERDGQLRSLLYFGSLIWKKKMIDKMFNDFKLLRVLKFEEMRFEVKLPSNIGDLVHLRFLSLKNSEMNQLPSSVASLVCLQTLDVRCKDKVLVKIPNVFSKMEQLRHLYMPYKHSVSEKLSLASLSSLQTLVHISNQDSDFKELVQLNNLRKLSVNFEILEEISKAAFFTMNRVQSLCVVSTSMDILKSIVYRCRYVSKLKVMGPIGNLPEDLPTYPNLTKLTLCGTCLEDTQIKILEKLPKLQTLFLGVGAFGAGSRDLVFSSEGFPSLEVLYLNGLSELSYWWVSEGAMPSLCRLYIENWITLVEVPRLQYVSTLKEITIKLMPDTFCSNLQEGGKDFYKIQHVPSVLFESIVAEQWDEAVKKRMQLAQERRKQLNQEKFRVSMYVQKAALQFIDAGVDN